MLSNTGTRKWNKYFSVSRVFWGIMLPSILQKQNIFESY